MDYSLFLAPAIIAGVFAYLVNFFGKIISDQMPVVDDRKWQIQLSGTMFMTNMLTGLLGIYLATEFPLNVYGGWLYFITILIFAFMYASLSSYSFVRGSEVYKHRTKQLAKADPKYKDERAILLWIGERIGTGVLPVVSFYFGTLMFLSGNIYGMIVTPVIILLMFMQYAYITSLKAWKDIVPVTIYFTNEEKEPLKEVTILKERDDSYRIRVGNTIILLSKSEVSRVEMEIPERLL